MVFVCEDDLWTVSAKGGRAHRLSANPGEAGRPYLSPDGKHLALLTAMSLWVFEKPEKGDDWLHGKSRRIDLPREKVGQAEGVCWDDDKTIRVNSESRGLFTISLSDIP